METTDLAKQDDVMVAMEEAFATIQQEAALVKPDRLIEWYIDQFDQAKQLKAKIKKQTQVMLNEIDNRLKAIQHVCGQDFKERVDTDLHAESNIKKDGTLRKKSVNYHTGKAGLRTSQETIKFVDEEAAKKWALANFKQEELLDAISSIAKNQVLVDLIWEGNLIKSIGGLNKTPFHDYLKATGEIPDGCELVEAYDKFYPAVDVKQLEGGHDE